MRFLNAIHPSSPAQGNTIQEYCLIGVLITLICIGGFSLMGTNWNDYMVSLKQDMLNHNQVAINAKAIKQQQITSAQEQQTANASVAPVGNKPANVTIETMGANGIIASYAQDILANAKQALASGSLTQAEYDVVVRLANKGHDIAQLQSLLEGAFKQSNGNSSVYAKTQLTFNGQSYTPAQLNAILESNISDFSALRSQASVQHGVLYTQTLLNSINDNGGKIINNGYSSQQQNQTADSFIQYQSEGVGGGSQDTHQQSATICTSGQHLDTNNHCTS